MGDEMKQEDMRQLRENEEAALTPISSPPSHDAVLSSCSQAGSAHPGTTGSKEDPRLAHGCHSPLCYLSATLAGHHL